ncbi:MAG: ATP-dependent DNA helicase RecG, partial [Clostridia bacterium]
VRYGLGLHTQALMQAHFPVNRDMLQRARRQLAFEEMTLYQAALQGMRCKARRGVILQPDACVAETFWGTLPFAPTGAQRRVVSEIWADLRSPAPMARLVQGDVGCGKTAIAFCALYAAVCCGWQGVMMAPTEILATQHRQSAIASLERLGVRCGLLTGKMSPAAKRAAHASIASGDWQIVFGTHALISASVHYARLGLVVTDEQHRFGVRQRTALSEKGDAPNVLVMSATPIPRTLALILYGDLQVSIVDELPPGRRPIQTRVVPETRRAGLYGFLHAEAARGRQAYIVCPLVEESEMLTDCQSAETMAETLRSGPLADLRLGLVHGRMRAAEKEQTLEAFRTGALDVLVATTVIEVGVNVPNATVMVIENAERFGLSQLHQLRGRVGRGSESSWCFLMAEPNERLACMTATQDGFQIAQKDLEIRGPGEFLGTRQHGLPEMPALAGCEDVQLLAQTQQAVRDVMQNPALAQEADALLLAAQRRFAQTELAMN